MNIRLGLVNIRHNLILFTVTLLVSAVLWIGSKLYASSQREIFVSIENSNRELSHKILRATNEIKTIDEHRLSIKNLSVRGILEQEHRLRWISDFKNQTQQLKLKVASFQIEPQSQFKAWSADLSHIDLQVSKMNIHLEMLHEGDLLTLLQNLESAPGYYHVNNCDIKRNGHSIAILATAQNVQAKCQLHWFTLFPEKRGDN